MKYLYYVIESGPALTAIDEMNEEHKTLTKERKRVVEKYGAKGCVVGNSGCSGLIFEDEPPANWTKSKESRRTCYLPGKRVEGWQEKRDEIKALRIVDSRTLQEKLTGRDDPFRFMCNSHSYFMAYEKIGDLKILTVPDVKATKDESQSGGIFNNEPWEAPEGCRPIKTSEYYRIKEEHEASTEKA
jgi:hypothetical protein